MSPVASSLIQNKMPSLLFFEPLTCLYCCDYRCHFFFIKVPRLPTSRLESSHNQQGPAKQKLERNATGSLFYIIISMFFDLFSLSGLMIASQASPIGQSMFGLLSYTAALCLSLFTANSSGCLSGDSSSDKSGRSRLY